ncbi:MAG: hypothetical protein RML57_00375, partial [Acidobacteriota bacterium]|nr:hypothetical protein [Acidobacteriota bacterium]
LYCLHEGVVRGLRPDWMGVVGVPALYRGERTRMSYVVEDEGRVPLIIVEALSPQTRRSDLAEYGRGAWAEGQKLLRKWDIYESVLKVSYYVTLYERRRWCGGFGTMGRGMWRSGRLGSGCGWGRLGCLWGRGVGSTRGGVVCGCGFMMRTGR